MSEQLHHLSIDLETYSEVSIGKAGSYRYILDPSFEILLFAYSLDGMPVEVIDVASGQIIPLWLKNALKNPLYIKHAYNAAFEWFTLSKYLGWLPPDQWRDTMLHALYCGYPASLDAAGKAMGLPEDKKKLATGKALIRYFCFSIAPVSPSILLCFLLGAAMIIVGIMFFTLGAEMSMTPMGERVGSMLTRSQNLFLIIGVGFLLGFLITISEPDLQVLANQVPSIPNMTLILSVAVGVGIFLVMAFLRMLLGIPLPRLLVIFYAAIFLLAAFVPKEFLAVAFDSGGVTTGPMTVPFIMALGVGVSAIRSDRHAADDSFGLVALCSVGPILAVLILGIVFHASESSYLPPVIPEVGDSVELWQLFSEGLPTYLHEIATSLLPIVVMFGIFQLAALHIDRRTLGRIGVGLVYTYIGLVLFLTGANIGFMPAGNYLGQVLGGQSSRWLLIPIGMLIGYFIVRAEPAVYVLNKQVEEVTDGAISAGTMGAALSAGVALSVGLAMVRVLTGISILWFLIPGYLFAISISFVVPKLYTAIAFDAGGVASGPMTATFLLPLAQGACIAVGGNIVTDAFGVVAMVAMTPLITVQLMGLVAQLKTRKARSAQPLLDPAALLAELPDDAIIEL